MGPVLCKQWYRNRAAVWPRWSMLRVPIRVLHLASSAACPALKSCAQHGVKQEHMLETQSLHMERAQLSPPWHGPGPERAHRPICTCWPAPAGQLPPPAAAAAAVKWRHSNQFTSQLECEQHALTEGLRAQCLNGDMATRTASAGHGTQAAEAFTGRWLLNRHSNSCIVAHRSPTTRCEGHSQPSCSLLFGCTHQQALQKPCCSWPVWPSRSQLVLCRWNQLCHTQQSHAGYVARHHEAHRNMDSPPLQRDLIQLHIPACQGHYLTKVADLDPWCPMFRFIRSSPTGGIHAASPGKYTPGSCNPCSPVCGTPQPAGCRGTLAPDVQHRTWRTPPSRRPARLPAPGRPGLPPLGLHQWQQV